MKCNYCLPSFWDLVGTYTIVKAKTKAGYTYTGGSREGEKDGMDVKQQATAWGLKLMPFHFYLRDTALRRWRTMGACLCEFVRFMKQPVQPSLILGRHALHFEFTT
jgi:hypothetical protein